MFDRTHRALSHPLRARILARLAERGEASPRQLAEDLGQPLEVISYHVRTLARAELLELVRTSERRGAVQHHYRAREPETISVRLALSEEDADAFERAVRELVPRSDGDGTGAVELTLVVHRAPAHS